MVLWRGSFFIVVFLTGTGTEEVTINADTIHGTDLLLLDTLRYQSPSSQTYRFEDFFWTGSGDDPDEETSSTWPTTTIYKTQTILSTIYVTPPIMPSNCSRNCPTTEISPTPTLPADTVSTEDFFDADRQFWLLTVLKSDGKDPVVVDLKNSLAKLYTTAFRRQQEKHLGITNVRKRRSANVEHANEEAVRVYLHNVETTGDEKIHVLYHVSVSGKPVDAITAAEDMTLISDDEVRNELGFPFVIKAEPYLKPTLPQSLSMEHNTWIFIGVSIVALLVVLLIVAFATLGCTKNKRGSSTGVENRKEIFERSVGHENKAFHGEQSPTYINFRNHPKQCEEASVRGSLASSSISSGSLDISPLMAVSHHKRLTPPKKPPRPKAASTVKRIAPELFDSDSMSSGSRGDPDFILPEGNFISPDNKSYLSMPSVKSFPRGVMPEPLNKVLEPVSVLHLDISDDDGNSSNRSKPYDHLILTRHGSVGTFEDPGIIGPIVWNMHKQRLQHGVSVDEGIDDLKVSTNVSKMRKRFHDLLDDTFSLFGSRRESPQEQEAHKPVTIEVKSRSAVNRASEPPIPRPRPKTTDHRRAIHSSGPDAPKGAWASTAPSPLIRPLSADVPVRPRVNMDHVLAEGRFKTNDPAIPLIAAIKNEIEKCSLPGSTADLRQ